MTGTDVLTSDQETALRERVARYAHDPSAAIGSAGDLRRLFATLDRERTRPVTEELIDYDRLAEEMVQCMLEIAADFRRSYEEDTSAEPMPDL